MAVLWAYRTIVNGDWCVVNQQYTNSQTHQLPYAAVHFIDELLEQIVASCGRAPLRVVWKQKTPCLVPEPFDRWSYR